MAALVTPDGVKRVLPNAAAVKAFAEERNIDGKLAGNLPTPTRGHDHARPVALRAPHRPLHTHESEQSRPMPTPCKPCNGIGKQEDMHAL